MLIPEQFRKCATVLCVDERDEATGENARTARGTAFFVADAENRDYYVVTARHVVQFSRPHGPLFLRLNRLDGSYEDIATNQDDWIEHDGTDIAITRAPFEPGYDVVFVPVTDFADQDYVDTNRLTEGDSVFFIGLFSLHPGRERVQPIARFGAISLMPREKVSVQLDPASEATTAVDAYLVEGQSWGGSSGSPAFVYFTRTGRQNVVTLGSTPRPALLGVVHGHYELPREIEVRGDFLGRARIGLNAGIAIVVPAWEILNTIVVERSLRSTN